MRKKGILYLLLILLVLFITACGSKKTSDSDKEAQNSNLDILNESGMPIVKEPITLKFFAGKHASNADDFNEVFVWKHYNELSGINIDWELVPFEGLNEKRNLALATGSLPDVFYTSLIPTNDLFKYGQQGSFIDVTDLIEEYMPNLSSILEEYPEVRKGITFPDGGIYGFPGLLSPDFESVLVGSKFWIREDWLDKLDMEIPQTTDDLYDYLKAVKETDLIGDGSEDEIPYGGYRINGLKEWLKGSYGLANKGIKNGYVDLDPETDEMRFYPTAEESKELLQYLNKLYEEGLISNNIYSIELQQSIALGTEGHYGSTVDTNPSIAFGDEGGKFIGIAPFEGPNGIRTVSYVGSPINWLGAMIITKDNKYPEATARWMDYFYGEEGNELFFMGEKDVSYEVTDDGEVKYTELLTNNPDGLSQPEVRSKYVTYGGGGYPGIVDQKYFQGAENLPSSLEAMERIRPFLIDEVWAGFTYTEEETKVLTAGGSDIEKYVAEMEDKFITGVRPFSEWDDYVKTIEGMGLEEYMEVNNAAYERYKNN